MQLDNKLSANFITSFSMDPDPIPSRRSLPPRFDDHPDNVYGKALISTKSISIKLQSTRYTNFSIKCCILFMRNQIFSNKL
jgi:hypothetical protein